MTLPVVDLKDRAASTQIRQACLDHGFFYVKNHGVDEPTLSALETFARDFFARSTDEKNEIAMARAGAAWRGYFPVEGELTSGVPDIKEGLYFGEELSPEDPRVRAGRKLHGPNLFPKTPGFRDCILKTMRALTSLGSAIMREIALSLGLPTNYFEDRYTQDPTVLFRIFHYPKSMSLERWGVGEHTDYGFLTILKQDQVGGLEVHTKDGWVEAPPIPGTFVCNIGDMLERMTGGLYLSTPHRVRSHPSQNRFSFPFFFDPAWDAKIEPINVPNTLFSSSNRRPRWDNTSVFEFGGTYGEYLLAKVTKVFPDLMRANPPTT